MTKNKILKLLLILISFLFTELSFSQETNNLVENRDSNENYLMVKIYDLSADNPLYSIYNTLIDSTRLKWACDKPTYLLASITRNERNTKIILRSNNGFKFFHPSEFDSTLIGIKIKETIVFCFQFYDNRNDIFKNSNLIDSVSIKTILGFSDITSCNYITYKKNKFFLSYNISFNLLKNNTLIFDKYSDFVDYGDFLHHKKKEKKEDDI